MLLTEAGFVEFADRFNNVVSTIGILRPYSTFSKKGKIWDKVWKDFQKLKIPKEYKILLRYQYMAKSLSYAFIFIILLFFSLPVTVAILTIIHRLSLS